MWNWVVSGRGSLVVLSRTAAMKYTLVVCLAQSPSIVVKMAQAHLDSTTKLARSCRHPAQRHLVTQQDWVYSDPSQYSRLSSAPPYPPTSFLSHQARVWVLVRSRDHHLQLLRRSLRSHRRTLLFLLRADSSGMMNARRVRWEVKAGRLFRLVSAWWRLWSLLNDGRVTMMRGIPGTWRDGGGVEDKRVVQIRSW